jgi:UDP-2-acetamido-3-amino-2,3-dideoxy-glucuronate N-acetyltransferase
MHANEIPAATPSYFAHPMALVDTTEIGQGTRVWAFAHIMPGAHVGSDCNIGEHTFIEDGASVGNHVTVKNGVSIWAGVTVEDYCFLGPHCVFTNDRNPRASLKKAPEALLPTRVDAHATIGANATILCGTTVGRFAFVGAGAVVLRDVPEYALVAGNPARQIGWMCACAARLPLKVTAAAGETCRCVHCGAAFVRVPSGLASLPCP